MIKSAIAILVLLFAVNESAQAHTRMLSPTPRTNRDNVKGAEGPCGAPRTANVTTYAPGQQVTISFQETVEHSGFFIAYFSLANDIGWQKLGERVDGNNDQGTKTLTVTLPTTPCENCTLQLVQTMKNAPPFNNNYFTCADIRIAGAGGTSTTGGTTGGDDEKVVTKGACGMISGGPPIPPWGLALLIFPLALALILRGRETLSTQRL